MSPQHSGCTFCAAKAPPTLLSDSADVSGQNPCTRVQTGPFPSSAWPSGRLPAQSPYILGYSMFPAAPPTSSSPCSALRMGLLPSLLGYSWAALPVQCHHFSHWLSPPCTASPQPVLLSSYDSPSLPCSTPGISCPVPFSFLNAPFGTWLPPVLLTSLRVPCSPTHPSRLPQDLSTHVPEITPLSTHNAPQCQFN